MKLFKTFLKVTAISIAILIPLIMATYLYFLPNLVSGLENSKGVQKFLKKNFDMELTIIKPVLNTSIKPRLSFTTELLTLKQNSQILLNLDHFNLDVDFSKILKRKIILNKLGADEIYADINKLQNLKFGDSKKEEKKGKPFFRIDMFNTQFYIKRCTIVYKHNKDIDIKLLARDLEITETRDPKYLHFKIYVDIDHNNEHVRILLFDKDTIYFKDKKFYVDNFKFYINRSKIFVNALFEKDGKYNVSVNSDDFKIETVNRFLNTNLFIPNGSDFVSSFKDFSGGFKFNLNFNDKGQNGFLKINQIGVKLIPLADIPLKLTEGTISFDNSDIKIDAIRGYYSNYQKNKVRIDGVVKDYMKTAVTEVSVKSFTSNDLMKHLSKLTGIDIKSVKMGGIASDIICKDNKIFVDAQFHIPPTTDILFNNASVSPPTLYRRFDIGLELFKNDLTINHLDYVILENANFKTAKEKKTPLITMSSKLNIVTGVIDNLEFHVPKPLPSEFFNVLIGQNLFRSGTFTGDMKYVNNPINPHLEGDMALKDVFISGQMTLIRNLKLNAQNNKPLKITSDGIIRQAKYTFDSQIRNKIVFPIVINTADFSVDKMDVERIMRTFAPRPKTPRPRPTQAASQRKMPVLAKSDISKEYFNVETNSVETTEPQAETEFVFQPDLLVIKRMMFNIQDGTYKKIKFGNLHTNLTLTDKGILEIKSNRFDFAEGVSSLRVYCDLVKQKYNIKLGAKDVDTDAISTSVLNLPEEISGKGKALMEFSTDESMKLNGKIQFEVEDGSIAKLGLVQYILNVATIFRNPIVVISPATLVDILNVPDGIFKKIEGTINIKDNVINSLLIKSSSPSISSFIVGRINLETMDVSLDIYTKFTGKKAGFTGFLRNLSLGSLANKASSYSKENRVSYYAAQLSFLPKLDYDDEQAHVYLVKIDGDIQTSNYISTVKKIK